MPLVPIAIPMPETLSLVAAEDATDGAMELRAEGAPEKVASRWAGRNLREPKQVVFVGKDKEKSAVYLSSAGPNWNAMENAVRAAEHRGKGETVELVGRESQERTTAMKSLRLNEAQCERVETLTKNWNQRLKAKSRSSIACGFAAARVVSKNRKEEELIVPDDAREPVSMSGMAEGDFGCRKQLSNGTMCQREPCAGQRRWVLRRASQGTPDKPKEPQSQGQQNAKGKGKGKPPESSKRNLEEEMGEEEEDSRGSRGRSQGRRGETRRDYGRSESQRRSKVSMAGRRRSRREEGNANKGVTSLHITSHNSTHHPASTRLKSLYALPLYTPHHPHHPPI